MKSAILTCLAIVITACGFAPDAKTADDALQAARMACEVGGSNLPQKARDACVKLGDAVKTAHDAAQAVVDATKE